MGGEIDRESPIKYGDFWRFTNRNRPIELSQQHRALLRTAYDTMVTIFGASEKFSAQKTAATDGAVATAVDALRELVELLDVLRKKSHITPEQCDKLHSGAGLVRHQMELNLTQGPSRPEGAAAIISGLGLAGALEHLSQLGQKKEPTLGRG